MPFEISESINNLADFMLNSPIINTVMSNPIYTSVIFSFFIILLVIIIFRDSTTSEPLLNMAIRVGVWAFILISAGMFLHNKILLKEIDNKTVSKSYNQIFNGGNIESFSLEDAILPNITL